MSTMSSDEIFEKVRELLMDALAVDEDEVTPDATLRGDLGAESIDWLDIVFRLEKTFNITIPRGELMPENVLSDPQYVQDGKVTPDGLVELRKRLPFANLDKFAENPNIQDFPELFTVQTVCNYVTGKLEAKAEQVPGDE